MPASPYAYERRQRLMRVLLGLSVVGAIASLCLWYWPEDLEIDPAIEARFEPHLPSYLGTFPPEGDGRLRVVGSLLPLEQHREGPSEAEIQAARASNGQAAESHTVWGLSSLYNSLPEDLVASAPSQVGTLARIGCWAVADGVYTAADSEVGTAYRQHCRVELVDLESRRQIGTRVFVGGEPAASSFAMIEPNSETANGSGDRYGSLPREEMLEFLISLPRE